MSLPKRSHRDIKRLYADFNPLIDKSKCNPKYPKRIQILITKDDDKIIKTLTEGLDCSKSEILRQAIRDFSKRYEAGNTLLLLRQS